MQDPETYLGERGIELRDFLDPERPASLDPALRSRIGFDVFYFADVESKRRFDLGGAILAGRLTDPVSWVRFQPTAESPRRTHAGRGYVFADAESAAAFDLDPDGYADAKGRMRGMAPPT